MDANFYRARGVDASLELPYMGYTAGSPLAADFSYTYTFSGQETVYNIGVLKGNVDTQQIYSMYMF